MKDIWIKWFRLLQTVVHQNHAGHSPLMAPQPILGNRPGGPLLQKFLETSASSCVFVSSIIGSESSKFTAIFELFIKRRVGVKMVTSTYELFGIIVGNKPQKSWRLDLLFILILCT